MKKFLLFSILLLSIGSVAFGQKKYDSFSIKGDLSNIKTKFKKAILLYPQNKTYITDTVIVTDQKFSFSGNLSYPILASIRCLPESGNAITLPLFLENGLIKIFSLDDQISSVRVLGSVSHNEFVKLKAKNDLFSKEIAEPFAKHINEARALKDTAKLTELRKLLLEKINKNRKSIYLDYVSQNPTSTIIYYCLVEGGGIPFNPVVVKPYFEALNEQQRQSEQGQYIREILDSGMKIKLGSYAPDFVLKTGTGKDVSLSSLKGKYVFVDFWASWCSPCRKEVPNVIKEFQNYKHKGFEVLAISLDEPGARDKWIKAIETDRSGSFIHVMNMKGSVNDVAKRYGVSQIPASFLINPDGLIVAINLRDRELQVKLKEIFK